MFSFKETEACQNNSQQTFLLKPQVLLIFFTFLPKQIYVNKVD
jgi:hypothetical protein